MTPPKEQAEELVSMFKTDWSVKFPDPNHGEQPFIGLGEMLMVAAQECALIVVNKILEELNRDGIVMQSTVNRIKHWEEVRTEINNLKS